MMRIETTSMSPLEFKEVNQTWGSAEITFTARWGCQGRRSNVPSPKETAGEVWGNGVRQKTPLGRQVFVDL